MSKKKIYLAQEAKIAIINSKNVFVLPKYSDYATVFIKTSITELFLPGINDHIINLVDNYQPPYDWIYSLGPIKFKMLKTYIEINLANGFIQLFLLLIGALVLFI